jgi:hypothetical protein
MNTANSPSELLEHSRLHKHSPVSEQSGPVGAFSHGARVGGPPVNNHNNDDNSHSMPCKKVDPFMNELAARLGQLSLDMQDVLKDNQT